MPGAGNSTQKKYIKAQRDTVTDLFCEDARIISLCHFLLRSGCFSLPSKYILASARHLFILGVLPLHISTVFTSAPCLHKLTCLQIGVCDSARVSECLFCTWVFVFCVCACRLKREGSKGGEKKEGERLETGWGMTGWI